MLAFHPLTPEIFVTLQTNPSGVAHLASGTLPAAGAYTNQSTFPIGAHHVRIIGEVTYTYGAAGGFVRLRPMWTIGGTEVQGTVQDQTVDTSAVPLGRQSVYFHEVNGPAPSSGSAIVFPVSFEVQAGATAFRLLASEAGVTGTPGTCAITLSGLVDL